MRTGGESSLSNLDAITLEQMCETAEKSHVLDGEKATGEFATDLGICELGAGGTGRLDRVEGAHSTALRGSDGPVIALGRNTDLNLRCEACTEPISASPLSSHLRKMLPRNCDWKGSGENPQGLPELADLRSSSAVPDDR